MLILKDKIQQILYIAKRDIRQKIDSLDGLKTPLNVRLKENSTIVTDLDEYISSLFQKLLNKNFPEVSFFSEENMDSKNFPVCILDPIDGTRELVAGNGECAVSFGIYFSEDFLDPRNFSWIYNPFTGFEISSEEIFSRNSSRAPLSKPLCYVSRSEYESNLYLNKFDQINLSPLGSIALKLGLLSAGASDMVLSLRDKNIWDIAAGIHIGYKRGFSFFESGVECRKIKFDLYKAPLAWGNKEILGIVSNEINIKTEKKGGI